MERADSLDFQKDFKKSLEILEDIQLLSEYSVSQLVAHAYFHLTEMKRKVDEVGNGKIDQMAAVGRVLDEKISQIIYEFFSNKKKFKGYSLEKETEKINLKKWNLIFDFIPEVLSITSLFHFHGNVEVKLDDHQLVMKGLILENEHFEKNRKLIYVITRKLLHSKVLLTFDLTKSSRTGLYELTLKTDFSHDDSTIYNVLFKATQNESYMVGFSNVLCNYRSSMNDLKKVGEHNIIEINHDLSMKHYRGLPDLSRMESFNKEILHFSFLFRPVSIILPMKGKLIHKSLVNCLEDDKYKSKQDVSKFIRSIDFFSLFNL